MSDDKKVIFSMSKLSKTYSSSNKQVLKDIYLSFFYGAKIGILGLNGSGKSSLLKIIAGVDKNYQGDVVFAPGYTVGYLEQEPQLDDSKTVLEIVQEGVAETMAVLEEYNQINDLFGLPENYEDQDKMDKLMDRQAALQDKIDALGAWEIDTKLEIAMDALRTPEGDTPIKNLSGGERRRVALCRLLLQQPDVLLLDEPTNHLDAESVLWLEQHLAQYAGTVIAVTHDRYFLDNVAGWILELDRGEGIPWKGNYSSWLDQKSNRMAMEEKVASKRRKTLERELDWVRQGAKGRQTKQKARLQNYDKLLNEDQKQLDENLEIYIPNGPRLGTNVIEAKNVAKAFGDKLLYDNLKKHYSAGLTYDKFVNAYDGKTLGILQASKVGPTVAEDIKTNAYWAVLGAMLIVGLYLVISFRKWQYSLGAIAAVVHDVIFVLGIYSLCYKFMPFGMEIDQHFIAAILTVIGYSMNDTVIVFDRVREFLDGKKAKGNFNSIVNQSINSTMSRTINTSLTMIMVLLIMFIFGGESIRGFIFAMLIGIVVGTYSSLFIATPVLCDTMSEEEHKRIEQEHNS